MLKKVIVLVGLVVLSSCGDKRTTLVKEFTQTVVDEANSTSIDYTETSIDVEIKSENSPVFPKDSISYYDLEIQNLSRTLKLQTTLLETKNSIAQGYLKLAKGYLSYYGSKSPLYKESMRLYNIEKSEIEKETEKLNKKYNEIQEVESIRDNYKNMDSNLILGYAFSAVTKITNEYTGEIMAMNPVYIMNKEQTKIMGVKSK